MTEDQEPEAFIDEDSSPVIQEVRPTPDQPPPPLHPMSTPLAVPPRVRREPIDLKPAWLLAGAAAAVAADLALRRPPWNNVAGSILIAVLAIGLLASGFLQTRTSRVFAALAVVFGAFLSLRTEPFLVTCTMTATIGLLLAAAVHGRERNFWDLRPMRLVVDAGQLFMESVVGIVEVPSEMSAQLRRAREASSSSQVWPALRGLAIAVPLLIVLGSLLASADVVFQSFFTAIGMPNTASLLGHIILLAMGAYMMMLLLRTAATQGGDEPSAVKASLGKVESTIILGGVILLFAGFAIAQLMTVLGGANAALNRAGVDPKQFARQGFFQLLWVAAITLAVLMALRTLASSEGGLPSILRWLSLATVALTLVIVGVAITRITFYINDGGQTPLRFYSAIFSVWIAVCFLIVAVRVWGYKPNTAWLLPVILTSGLAVLGLLNIANPERIIALDNLNRDHDALVYHVEQPQFTSDGYGELSENINKLSPERRERVIEAICQENRYRSEDRNSGWLDFNLGRSKARDGLKKLC